MIHYHGTPIGGSRQDVVRFLTARHALVSFAYQEDMGAVADVCQSFVLDNGAFTAWRQGGTVDFDGYIKWVEQWHRHPSFDWCLIPDVIDGTETENDALIQRFPKQLRGVPVWHLHESVGRLRCLAESFQWVALGSSGQFSSPGTDAWWKRIGQAMDAVCDSHGRPICRLHGLRMLNHEIFTKLPLSSADSTNAAQNSGSATGFGMYVPVTKSQRAAVIADRVESHNSACVWAGLKQQEFELC